MYSTKPAENTKMDVKGQCRPSQPPSRPSGVQWLCAVNTPYVPASVVRAARCLCSGDVGADGAGAVPPTRFAHASF